MKWRKAGQDSPDYELVNPYYDIVISKMYGCWSVWVNDTKFYDYIDTKKEAMKKAESLVRQI